MGLALGLCLYVFCRLAPARNLPPGLEIYVVNGCGTSHFFDFLNLDQIASRLHLAQDRSPVKVLSGKNIHSNDDAGLHGPGRIMVGYLKHILAILSRSSSMRAPMLFKQPLKASDFFFEEAEISTDSLVFQIWTRDTRPPLRGRPRTLVTSHGHWSRLGVGVASKSSS